MKKLFFAFMAIICLVFNLPTQAKDFPSKTTIFQEKQYKKITVSDIPKEVLDKIKKSYGSYSIKEAYKADDGEYKLVLSKDGVDLTATFTQAGDLIKILN